MWGVAHEPRESGLDGLRHLSLAVGVGVDGEVGRRKARIVEDGCVEDAIFEEDRTDVEEGHSAKAGVVAGEVSIGFLDAGDPYGRASAGKNGEQKNVGGREAALEIRDDGVDSCLSLRRGLIVDSGVVCAD